MRGEKQHALASGHGALEVFESFIDNDFANILASVAAEEADLRSLSAE